MAMAVGHNNVACPALPGMKQGKQRDLMLLKVHLSMVLKK
jgi:hypothetical protein